MERLTQLTTFGVNQTSAGGYHGSSYAVLSGDELLFNLVENASSMTGFVPARGARPFHIDGLDSSGKPVFSIRRTLEFMADKMEIYMNGALVCIVHVEVMSLKPVFRIHDAQDRQTLSVKGQFGITSQFRIQTPTKTDIGTIDKKWQAWGVQLAPLLNDYVVNLPADLAVQFKIAVIATCVLVDFKFIESK